MVNGRALLWLLLGALLALSLSSCLRVEFDRCEENPPHPDCLLLDGAVSPDAGPGSDAGPDAG